jgi:hypothetical protein
MKDNGTEIFAILMLCAPLFAELYDDRDGDEHPNQDWIWRGVLMIIFAALAAFMYIELYRGPADYFKKFGQNFVLSFGIFSLFFPYLINIAHNKKRWWDSLSKTAWPDKVYLWRMTPWYGRLFILLVLFGVCVIIYTCPGKILSFYNPCNH